MLEEKLDKSFEMCSKRLKAHCRRTGDLIHELLCVLEWQEVEELWRWRGKLPYYYHDIGKELKKSDPDLSHTEIGNAFFGNLFHEASDAEKGGGDIFFSIAADTCMYHHEWFNGYGRPFGKKGQEIALIGRLCAVADTWDNLTHDTPGKPALSERDAIEVLEQKRNIQLEDYIVQALFKLHDYHVQEEQDVVVSPIIKKRHFWSR